MLPKAKPLTLLSSASTAHTAQKPQVYNLELDSGRWDQETNKQTNPNGAPGSLLGRTTYTSQTLPLPSTTT